MTRRFCISVFLFVIVSSLNAQSSDSFMNSIIERVNSYYLNKAHDHQYLHTDRSVYFPGDEIFVKAYVNDAPTMRPSERSNMYTLLLVDYQGNEVFHADIEVIDGLSFSMFQIPEEIAQGPYSLIAFAMDDIMISSEKTFSKRIFVIDPEPGIMMEYKLDKETYITDDNLELELRTYTYGKRPLKRVDLKCEMLQGDKSLGKEDKKTDKEGRAVLSFKVPENSGDDLYINVLASKRKDRQEYNIRIPLVRKVDRIEFFPEGGTLVGGEEGKIGFRAYTSKGRPVDFSGALFRGGERMMNVSSMGEGIGVFSLTPDPGQKYELRIEGSDKSFALPPVENNAAALRVYGKSNGKLHAGIAFKGESYPDDKAIIIGLFRKGLLYWSAPGTLAMTSKMDIPVKRVPPGVSTLVLFSKQGDVISTRTFYNEADAYPGLNITLNRNEFGKRQKVEAMVKLEGPVPTNANDIELSASVVSEALILKNNVLMEEYFMVDVDFLEDTRSLLDKLERRTSDELMDAMTLCYTWNGYSWDMIMGKDKELVHEANADLSVLNPSSVPFYPQDLKASALMDLASGISDKRQPGTGEPHYKKQLANGMSVLEVIKSIKPYSMQGDKIIFSGGTNSFYNQQGALIIIDNQPMGESASVLKTISPTEVESINISTNPAEIQRYTGLNVVGVIEINMKGSGQDSRLAKMSDRDVEIMEANGMYLPGYPDYSEENDVKSVLSDHRKLIYLNAGLLLDENMQQTIEFYTSDTKGDYVMTIQGMVGMYPVSREIRITVK